LDHENAFGGEHKVIQAELFVLSDVGLFALDSEVEMLGHLRVLLD